MPASCRSARSPIGGIVIISPNDPGAMLQYAEECRTLGIPYVWDPGQQCARMSGDELRDGLVGATIVICNDYEFELIRQKTGLDEAGILAHTRALVVTRGEHGCSIHETTGRTDVPAVPPHRIVDPTGVGDAFRGGFLKGMARGVSYEMCARLGQRRRRLRAGASRRSEPRLYLGGVQARVTKGSSASSPGSDHATPSCR